MKETYILKKIFEFHGGNLDPFLKYLLKAILVYTGKNNGSLVSLVSYYSEYSCGKNTLNILGFIQLL